MGRREGRMFDCRELRLVILALVAEKPRYGYEIIKELGERVGGEYSPSPGVVYPTLTMLEEMGYASANQDQAGRKLYTLTPEGEKTLAEHRPQVDAIFERFGDRDGAGGARGMGSVVRADDEPARSYALAPARPGRNPGANPGDRRCARRSGESDRAGLIRRAAALAPRRLLARGGRDTGRCTRLRAVLRARGRCSRRPSGRAGGRGRNRSRRPC